MDKKNYFLGLFTGFMITAFLAVMIVLGKMVYDKNHKTEAEKIHDQVEDTVKRKEREVSASTDADDKDKKDIDSGYILSDDAVVDKILLLEDTIDRNYIDSVSDEDLKNGMYDGLIDALGDPYAEYYTAEELIQLQQDTQGIYYGVGARLMQDTELGYPQIVGIIDNSPASEVDLRVDDYIYLVNGQDIHDMELSEAVKLIKGEEGTTVDLTLYRPSTNEQVEITVERRKVENPTVSFKMLDDDVAYIQITEFDAITVGQFEEAMAEAKGSGMKGLVLDLRGNPGGSVSAVVDIAGMLLPKGLVVYTEDKYGTREEYKSDGKNEIQVPMVVLVNGRSASASEILSGAIKDYKKGVLMGTTTYGKGIVQRVIPFLDGSAVKLTVSHYYTPLGNDIHKVGIEPDVVVEFDADAYEANKDDDNQIKAAHEYILNEIK